jgi:hypothetical protein
MATVYLATDVKHRRQVAVKVMRPELAATLGAERFLREVEIAAQLSHPHILPVHDSGESEGVLSAGQRGRSPRQRSKDSSGGFVRVGDPRRAVRASLGSLAR